MKIIVSFLFTAFLITGCVNISNAQTSSNKGFVQEIIHVDGACNNCKSRIEKAARIKGVKQAVWDKSKHQLKVIYRQDKTNRTAICRAIAAIGHDTDEIKAEEQSYQNLPGCCQYREVADH